MEELKTEKMYYLFEKGEENSYKKYSFTELMRFFAPSEDAEAEAIEEYNAIENIFDLSAYIENYVNNDCGLHIHDYFIEEV